jgi:hypothetical protein
MEFLKSIYKIYHENKVNSYNHFLRSIPILINAIEDFSISPNPTEDYFSITSNSNIKRITVYSIMGQKIKDLEPSNASYLVADLASGNCIIQVSTSNGIRNKNSSKSK